jgi:hypothetical protein
VEGDGELPVLFSPQSSCAETEVATEAEEMSGSPKPAKDSLSSLAQDTSNGKVRLLVHDGTYVHGAKQSASIIRSRMDVAWCILGLLSVCVLLAVVWSVTVFAAMAMWSFVWYWIWIPVLYWAGISGLVMHYVLPDIISLPSLDRTSKPSPLVT